jgi:hypothetical protein
MDRPICRVIASMLSRDKPVSSESITPHLDDTGMRPGLGDGTGSYGDSAGVVAVGTPIAERPPHRTVRAQLRHTAPTSGV